MAEGITDTVRYIWENNRPLAYALLAGAGGLALYLVHRAQTQTIPPAPAAAPAAPDTANQPVYQPMPTYAYYTPMAAPAQPAPAAPIQPVQPTPGTTPPTMPPPVPPSVPVSGNPIIPYGQLPAGTRYSTAADLKAQPTLVWGGITYTKQPGPSGKLYGTPINGGAQVLLYGPPSAYR